VLFLERQMVMQQPRQLGDDPRGGRSRRCNGSGQIRESPIAADQQRIDQVVLRREALDDGGQLGVLREQVREEAGVLGLVMAVEGRSVLLPFLVEGLRRGRRERRRSFCRARQGRMSGTLPPRTLGPMAKAVR